MDRQCFEVCSKNCEFFIPVAYHDRHRYIFYNARALAIHRLFRSEKHDRETVSPRRSGWWQIRILVVELCPTTPRKMSKGNYERYKFLTECLSFIHTLWTRWIDCKKWNKHIFVNNSHPPSLPRNDLKNFSLVRCRIFLWNNSWKKREKEKTNIEKIRGGEK